MDRLEEKPLVSCHIITYNQKDYITKCIEGALMQETSFPYEIVIGDDCSTDGTREILLEYANKYPEKIRLNLRKQRGKGIPGQENFHSTLALCKGKYVAICDGDDYWNDPTKIQQQADYLENNPSCVLVSHNANTIDTNGNILSDSLLNIENQRSFSQNELMRGPWIPSLTRMFRNNLVHFPENLRDCLNGDLIFVCLLSQYGHSQYLASIIPSSYRIQNDGVWSALKYTKQFETLYYTLSKLKTYFRSNPELKKFYSSRILEEFQLFYTTHGDKLNIVTTIDLIQCLTRKKTNFELLKIINILLKKVIVRRIIEWPYYKLKRKFFHA